MKLFYPILFLFILLGLSNCSNEFDLIESWKDIPVLYGLINPDDAVHYIRLEKAFLDPDDSAFEVAQIADSLYYKNASLRLEDDLGDGIYNLEMVNATELGLEREEGIFATDPNYVYRFEGVLKEINPYTLYINRGNGSPEISATFTTIKKPKVWLSSGRTIAFEKEIDQTEVVWATRNGQIFEIELVFNYEETLPEDSTVFYPKQIELRLAKNLFNRPSREVFREKISHAGFYQSIADKIEEKNVKRGFKSIDIIVYSGGEELLNYNVSGSANSGLTGYNPPDPFTNLSEGLGILSSVNKGVLNDVRLTTEGRDSLRMGQQTKHLNFKY